MINIIFPKARKAKTFGDLEYAVDELVKHVT